MLSANIRANQIEALKVTEKLIFEDSIMLFEKAQMSLSERDPGKLY